MSRCFYLFIFNFLKFLFIFEREREPECEPARGRERGRHRIQSQLQAPSCQHRAWCGAWTHQLWDHDLKWSWMLDWLSCPGTPVKMLLKEGRRFKLVRWPLLPLGMPWTSPKECPYSDYTEGTCHHTLWPEYWSGSSCLDLTTGHIKIWDECGRVNGKET